MNTPSSFNFTNDVVARNGRRRPDEEALRTLSAAGERRSYTFREVAAEAESTAAALHERGVRAGDVVMTLIGARPEWVLALLGTWRLGAVALPCSEQLRAKDIALRIERTKPRLILFAERDGEELERALATVADPPPHINVHNEQLSSEGTAPPVTTAPDAPALVIFTSGTAGEPRGAVHTQRYLWGQSVQAEHWLGARQGDLVWCTAASGWSKSARNAFVAPWTMGAACFLQDARLDPSERLDLVESEGISVLCQAPTEYRMIAKRASLDRSRPGALRRLVSAGEPLNPEVMQAFHSAFGLDIHDGYGQTETGQLTGVQVGDEVRPGSMGKPLPGFALDVVDGELCLDPTTVPTFFQGYLGEQPHRERLWRTGDHVRRDEDGYLWFEGRLDDVILSAGYRIGPFEVESALVSHPAVAEAAAVAAPDDERGAVVRAVVVLRDGRSGDEQLVKELQEHVKDATAPYKYPRIVEFRDSLPKTASGKIKRAELRQEHR